MQMIDQPGTPNLQRGLRAVLVALWAILFSTLAAGAVGAGAVRFSPSSTPRPSSLFQHVVGSELHGFHVGGRSYPYSFPRALAAAFQGIGGGLREGSLYVRATAPRFPRARRRFRHPQDFQSYGFNPTNPTGTGTATDHRLRHLVSVTTRIRLEVENE